MLNFYVRFGRRVPIPSTIEILDQLDPGYRKRLVRENRERPSPPRPVILPAWVPEAANRRLEKG